MLSLSRFAAFGLLVAIVITGPACRGGLFDLFSGTGLKAAGSTTMDLELVDPGTRVGFGGLPLSQPVRVRAMETHCPEGQVCGAPKPVAAQRIVWSVSNGGGTLNTTSSLTDSSGFASVEWTLGSIEGDASVTATAVDLAEGYSKRLSDSVVTIIATVILPQPVISRFSGDAQSAKPGKFLGNEVVVQVTRNSLTGAREPIPNLPVTWTPSGDGIASPVSVTDANGKATTTWKLATSTGQQTLVATIPTIAGSASNSVFTTTLHATAFGSIARVLRVVSGNNQSSPADRAQLAPVVVEYVLVDPDDGSEVPISNAPITFTPLTGSGVAAPTSATTDAEGRVSALWTLGFVPGTHTLFVSTPPIAGSDASSVFEVAVSANAEPAALRFEDPFSNDGSTWTTMFIRNDENAWQHTVTHVATGGNPLGFRQMTHTMTITTFPEFASSHVAHVYSGVTYNPQTQGAILSIDHSMDHRSTGDVLHNLLIIQNGVSYRAQFPSGSAVNGTAWTSKSMTGLTAGNFAPAGLDLSQNGLPLQFGYVRGNSSRFPNVNEHDIDNWAVVLHR